MDYEPKNWYWVVAGDETKAYSSATGDYVQADNATYRAWRAAGGVPTRIANEAELGEVLAPYVLRPTASGVLDAYKNTQAVKITVETIAKVLFNHENRLRALEGQSSVTANQFRTAIKGLM